MDILKTTCESVNQTIGQYTARFVVLIPGAQKVENKMPVRSIITIQLPGSENPGYQVGKEYEIGISEKV